MWMIAVIRRAQPKLVAGRYNVRSLRPYDGGELLLSLRVGSRYVAAAVGETSSERFSSCFSNWQRVRQVTFTPTSWLRYP